MAQSAHLPATYSHLSKWIGTQLRPGVYCGHDRDPRGFCRRGETRWPLAKGTTDAPTPCMLHGGSFTLFRVRGVPLKVHWSLLLVLPYLAFALSAQFDSIAILAGVDPSHLVMPPILWGGLLAVALFASVAIHELAHTWIALRYGGRVRSITLMALGGVSQMLQTPKPPRQEAVMAAAGPLTSLVLGLGCATAYTLVDLPPDLRMTVFYLATMNIWLALFNLLPAFPMDGGRVLRAMLAARVGRARATEIAAAIGKGVAFVLALVAAAHASLLLGLIAVFIYAGATGEAQAETLGEALALFSVRDMLPVHQALPVVDAARHLDEAALRMAELDRTELVVSSDAGPVAIVEADDVLRLGNANAAQSLGALTQRLRARFAVAAASAPASAAVEAAAAHDAPYVVVVEPPSTIVGLIGPGDIARAVKLRAACQPTTAAKP